MEGLREQFGAKLGPLPVWAWALLAVLAVLAWMYVTKSGFFSNRTADTATGPSDATSVDSGVGGALPVSLGGLAGGGNPGSVSAANPLPGYYDPGSGGYVGTGFSDANAGSTPSFDLSGTPTASVGSIVGRLGGDAPGFTDTPQQPSGLVGALASVPLLGNYIQNTTQGSTYISGPALNQGNPVSDYGRGN